MLDRTPRELDRALRGGMTDAMVYLNRQMTTYPPQRTGSAYKRTGTLGRSWSWKIDGTGAEIVGRLGSNANIAPYNR